MAKKERCRCTPPGLLCVVAGTAKDFPSSHSHEVPDRLAEHLQAVCQEKCSVAVAQQTVNVTLEAGRRPCRLPSDPNGSECSPTMCRCRHVSINLQKQKLQLSQGRKCQLQWKTPSQSSTAESEDSGQRQVRNSERAKLYHGDTMKHGLCVAMSGSSDHPRIAVVSSL